MHAWTHTHNIHTDTHTHTLNKHTYTHRGNSDTHKCMRTIKHTYIYSVLTHINKHTYTNTGVCVANVNLSVLFNNSPKYRI